ncbi:hypothetical protein BKA61DRAFT_612879 [Leptodontidium sp. MPI-SDFR-AT-0119]|nr:hypothetical protein BKA61DRAFT_612879 [Leptodontidium sp. MPI-SDFR-AT-0119]
MVNRCTSWNLEDHSINLAELRWPLRSCHKHTESVKTQMCQWYLVQPMTSNLCVVDPFMFNQFKATVAFSILGVKSPPPAIRTKVIPKVLTMKMELCDHEVSQTLLKIVVAEISPTTLSRVLIGDTHQIHKEEIHLEIPPLEDRSTSATYHLHMMALFQLATESFRHQLQAIHSTLQTVASVVVVLELRPQQTMCRTFTILRP